MKKPSILIFFSKFANISERMKYRMLSLTSVKTIIAK